MYVRRSHVVRTGRRSTTRVARIIAPIVQPVLTRRRSRRRLPACSIGLRGGAAYLPRVNIVDKAWTTRLLFPHLSTLAPRARCVTLISRATSAPEQGNLAEFSGLDKTFIDSERRCRRRYLNNVMFVCGAVSQQRAALRHLSLSFTSSGKQTAPRALQPTTSQFTSLRRIFRHHPQPVSISASLLRYLSHILCRSRLFRETESESMCSAVVGWLGASTS